MSSGGAWRRLCVSGAAASAAAASLSGARSTGGVKDGKGGETDLAGASIGGGVAAATDQMRGEGEKKRRISSKFHFSRRNLTEGRGTG